MPFPWKKNRDRVTRISQIVADLQSPKRGGSLVVETGFPTSLIDLFVKNRSRFRKSKSTKPVQPEIQDPPPPPPPPSPATTHPPIPGIPDLQRLFVPLAEATLPNRSVPENAGAVSVSGRVRECGIGSGQNKVVGVFVKMLVVLVLIASVKRLTVTVGITVSAFALVFLEYAGKRVVSQRFGPFSNANVAMEYLSKTVSSRVCFQKLLQLKGKKKSNCEVGSVQLGSGSSFIDEIEVVESNIEVDICCEESCFVDELDLDDSSIGISECKSRGSSRSGRFKSKMVKKLVPKKFRGSKKEKIEKRSKEVEVESGSEVSISSAVDEDKSHSFEIEEEQENSVRSTKLVCVRDDDYDEVDYDGITCSQESLLAKEEVAVTENNEKRIDRVGNSGYIILLVIALAGLVVGRSTALILTMTWCFILKIVKTLWRSQKNVPLIKYSVPN